MKDNKELKTCDIFSQKQDNFENIKAKYAQEILSAGGDYAKVQEIQEKYSDYFVNAGTEILKGYKEKEDSPDERVVCFDRIMTTEDNKLHIRNANLENLIKTGMCIHMDAPVRCVCCAKEIHGFGLTVLTDNSYICFDCCDDDNYFDCDRIKLFYRD